ncbi:TolC family outer membrane protein [uncultured Pseudacidovorax sp.]|uniref:TolC family outer membrane protein n=1 Tax=uncultured Pseudacidovorax sp. TaxID=679313 RepID=UPI0025D9BB4F|nr:TolC family outer membrane protein [uncultured Pseudacidovorax sp.]
MFTLTFRPVAVAALLVCSAAVAQTPSTTAPAPTTMPASAANALPPASLGDAVNLAINRNPEVLARLRNYQASEADQAVARAALRPQVDLQAFAGYQNSRVSGGENQSYSRPGANLQLRQTLFDGGGASSDTRRAGFARLSRYYDYLAVSDEIALQAVQAYIDVARYRDLERLAADNWGFHNETREQLDRRASAGVGKRVDLELAQGRAALSQSNWLTDSANLHDVSQRFQRLVGQLPAAQLSPVPDASNSLPPGQQLLADAMRTNPAFQSAVAGIRAARADLDVRNAAKSPTVAFVAQTGTDKTLSSVDQVARTQNSSVQVVLNYNLYRGGADDARARAAQENVYASQDARDLACRNIRQTATIAYNDLRRLREQLNYLEQHQLSSEKAREAYRQQFDIGQRSLLDLLDTENEVFQARRAVVNARYDYLLAGYRVLQQTNGLLPNLGQKPLMADAPEVPEGGEAEDEAVLCSTEMTPPQVLDTAAVVASRPPLQPTPGQTSPAPRPLPVPADTTPDTSGVAATVQAWARTWSAKDLNNYMAFYSSTFRPQQGSVEAWKSLRTTRVTKAGPISVVVENLQVRADGANAAQASFKQTYRSDDYNDVVNKTLRFVREGQAWKIQSEVATPAR